MTDTTIDFIRHTRLRDIDGSLCYGRTDLDVAPSFSEEAEAVRRTLTGRRYDVVFTSPLRRARKLAAYCGYEEVARVDARLAERHFGEWEMRPWQQLMDEVRLREGLTPLERQLPELVTPPGGEGVLEMRERVLSLVREVCAHASWRRVAFFCHGGVINMGRWLRGEIDEAHLFRDVPPYGSVTTLTFAADEEGGTTDE